MMTNNEFIATYAIIQARSTYVRNTYMQSAARNGAWKFTRSLQVLCGQLLKIFIIPCGILQKVYLAISHRKVSNL